MFAPKLAVGTVHNKIPADLHKALTANKKVVALWNGLTPLARNEWICWATNVKLADTRADHVRRTVTELQEGKRRPCCWLGCIHRTDKKLSPSVRAVLARRKK